MYYYGQNYGYPGYAYGYNYPQQSGGNYGGLFAIILVIFILLVIIGCGCGNFGGCNHNGGY